MSRSHCYIALFTLTVVLAGALGQAFYATADADKFIDLAMFLPWIILLRLWVGADAEERAVVMPTGAAIAVPLVAIIGVPYYLIRSRKLSAALWQVPLAIAFMFSLGYVYWAGQLIAYFFQTR
jgi:hypothetical protein